MQVKVNGHLTDVVDELCPHRPCFRLGFDKGSFTQGVGYTSYYEKARPVCMTRHLNGCPHVGMRRTCSDCRWHGPVVLNDAVIRVSPAACPRCGGTDLYWLADVLPPAAPCCATPDLPAVRAGHPAPWRQTCRSCGTKLTGARLEQIRTQVTA